MTPKIVPCLLLAGLLVLFPSVMAAQQITGTLTGIVTDSAGAVVPAADVALTNEASGSVLRTKTNGEGFFSIAGVFSGSYTLRITAQGFTTLERTAVVFRPGDRRHLSDLQMALGTVTETVTISAAPDTLTPLDSAEQSSVITGEQLRELSVVGRSAAEFIKVLPGMAPTGSGVVNAPGYNGEVIGINGNGDGGNGRQSALGYFSPNGQRGSAMDIVTDGANTADPGCNCATPVNPNIDMIAEFKVMSGTYTAEHSKGPVVMVSVTKSGGRDFHGSGYYYIRDSALASNDWALNRAGQAKPTTRYQFPGANFGGPVLIPGTDFNKNRDKLFFFAGYEYMHQQIDTGALNAVVPTEAMLNGNFSDTAYMSRLPADAQRVPVKEGIVNGIIPQSMWEQRGRTLMGLFPKPNADPALNSGRNYVQSLVYNQPMHQFATRMDYNLSDYTKLFVRYNLQREQQHFPVTLWGRSGDAVPYPTETLGANRSDSISASLTKVFNPTMTNEAIFGYTFIDFPNTLENPEAVSRQALGYPVEGIYDNGVDQMSNVTFAQNLSRIFNRGGFNPVYPATKWLISAADNFSMFRGSHSLKMGFHWQVILQDQPDSGNSQGIWTFQPTGNLTSGNAFADALLGIYRTYQEQNSNLMVSQGFNAFEWYAQDSWKATRTLTLELGIRFSHLQPWSDHSGTGVGFGIFDPSRYSNNPDDLTKYTGLVYHGIDPTIPLAGAKTKSVFFQPRLGLAWDVTGSGATIMRAGFGVFRYNDITCCGGAYNFAAGQRSTTLDAPGFMRDVNAVSPRLAKTGLTVIDQNDDRKPVSYNWSFELGQRLHKDMYFRTAYVGNAGRELLDGGNLRNINKVPVQAMIDSPNSPTDNFRPLQNYSSINRISHGFISNYHSLQSSFSMQARDVNIQAAYTFSKALGTRGQTGDQVADGFNLDNNYGVLGIDRTHMFSIAYIYQVPELVKSNAFLKGLVNGWEFSGITTFASGIELSAADSTNFGVTGFLEDGTTRINAQAVNGTDALSAQPFVTCDPRENLAPQQFINGGCFAPPGRLRNGPTTFGYYLRGPALYSHDLSLFKNFAVGEGKRLQIRASAYNFPNHPLWTFRSNDTALDLNFDEAGKLSNASTFGYAGQKTGRRVIQLGIKFYF
jgi:hypothetical protein